MPVSTISVPARTAQPFLRRRRPPAASAGAAGIGDDTVGAELVAAVLHFEDRAGAGLPPGGAAGRPAWTRRRRRAGRGGQAAQGGEPLQNELGQAGFLPVSDDEVGAARAADGFGVHLGVAAGHGDKRVRFCPRAADELRDFASLSAVTQQVLITYTSARA